MAAPTGNNQLDHLERAYKLRQDIERCDGLEAEEKALVHLQAQEYDALKVLSCIEKDSDLYQFKLEQYKKMSEVRARIENHLQEQRV